MTCVDELPAQEIQKLTNRCKELEEAETRSLPAA